MVNRYLNPRHHCWYCKEMYEEPEMVSTKLGWLCKTCFAYITCTHYCDYLKTKG